MVDSEQKAQQKAVVLGQGMGKLIAVDAELSAGEQIVIRGGDTLTQGDKVKVLTDKEFPIKT
ncbi:Multidrug resistance protein MdtA [compost metagenome]